VVVALIHSAAVAAVIAVVTGSMVQHVPVYLGLVATSYALGLRHAFDADHIAVIDNASRRLVALGRSGGGIGLWFSLGHSTIVVAMCAAIAIGVRPEVLGPDGAASGFRGFADVFGPLVSGVVVVALAVVNVVLLARCLRRTRRAGEDGSDGSGAGIHPPTGLWSSVLAKAGWVVDRPWRMYLVGAAFGLGLDTATEVGLLAISSQVASGQPAWLPVLALPLGFAAGMSLLDAAQGAAARRVYERHNDGITAGNLAMTAASALTALIVGSAEIGATLSSVDGLGWIPHVDVTSLGFVLTAVLLVVAGAGPVRRLWQRGTGRRATAGPRVGLTRQES
jgi:high-affinity nickel-transport protein